MYTEKDQERNMVSNILKDKKQNKVLRRSHNPFPKPNFLSFCYTKKTEEFRIIIEETVTKLYNYNYQLQMN